MILIKSNL